MVQPPRRKPALLGTDKAILNGLTVPYAVKRSFRAKHARLEVRAATGLTVVIPGSYNINDISALLRKKERWILDKLAKYVKGYPITEGKEPKSGNFIPYLGRRLKVVTRHNPDTAVSISMEKNRLLVNLNHQNGRLNLVLEWWYRQQAERLIKQKADELCPRLGVTYVRLTVRGAKTRWGSCSQKGNINFNWKLMMAPEPVIDYVIIHELTHLKEMNHSKNFWKLVAEYCPQWRKQKRWLKEHESKLAFKLSG
jgi:predicted metal-dependent hydrolase